MRDLEVAVYTIEYLRRSEAMQKDATFHTAIITPPQLPGKPSIIQPLIALSMATIIGMLCACIAAILADFFETSGTFLGTALYQVSYGHDNFFSKKRNVMM